MTRRIYICMNHRINGGASCASGGAELLAAELNDEITRRNLDWRVVPNACMGLCGQGPNIKAAPGGPLLSRCRAQDSSRLIDLLLTEWIET